jgi:transposase
MIKYRMMLKLALNEMLSCNVIAEQVGMSHHTVRRWQNIAKEKGLTYDVIADLPDSKLRAIFRASSVRSEAATYVCWAREHERCRQNRTKEEAYSLYLGEIGDENAVSYRTYCANTYEYQKTLDPIMRIDHVAGYAVQTDFAGMKVKGLANEGNQEVELCIFVAALPFSGLIAAFLTWSENTSDHLDANVRAFEYFGGVPRITVPDNTKAAVISRPKYRPAVLNSDYVIGLNHYNMGCIPARPYKPQDKAVVENSVKLIQARVGFKLRNKPLQRVAVLHEIVAEAVEYWNNRALKRGKGQSRRSLFETEECQHLQPLPAKRFAFFKLYSKRRVAKDYHIEFDSNYYSVPFQYKSFDADVKAERSLIHILIDGVSVATHLRLFCKGQRSTNNDHRPPNHRIEGETDLREWAKRFCVEVQQIVEVEMESPPRPLRLRWIKDLPRMYSVRRFEAASKRAVDLNDLRFEHVDNVLKRGIESMLPSLPMKYRREPKLNVRGAGYFRAEEKGNE